MTGLKWNQRCVLFNIIIIFVCCSTTLAANSNHNCAIADSDVCRCEENASGYLTIDCSGHNLNKYPDFTPLKAHIYHLDLSNNQFTTFPENLKEFSQLNSLDLSNNQIAQIPSDALSGCTTLQYLYLSSNNITNWSDIYPNKLLLPALALESFSLSGNPLSSFTNVEESLILVSSSLKLLDLSYCHFTRITDHVLDGLPKIEHLLLNDNPLRLIGDISSESLRTLSLSNCKLTYMRSTIFSKLPSLTYVSLARNHRLSLERHSNETIRSQSLKEIDLSYCNMDQLEIASFPNIITVVMRGNLISHLNRFSFDGNGDLQNIDLSYNAITNVTSGAFRGLKYLKRLDLSFNMIRKIESDIFKQNDYLTDINLSRNFIDRFNRFSAKSLTYLNMSWCEIMSIDLDAFVDLPAIVQLDLSNNLFTNFPVSLHSDTLQTLDLGRCRLTHIRNETFQGFPELSSINLAGNRLTNPFRREFFSDNPYVRDIWLGDNPWRCDCAKTGFFDFYTYLTSHPTKVNDRNLLRCFSPDNLYALTWEVACFSTWYMNEAHLGTAQKVWMFLMVAIIVFSATVCIFMTIRKCLQERKAMLEEEERLQNVEEAREVARLNRIRLEQQAQLNAPDPRESHPPCYADAIRLPRLDGTYVSLEDISLKRGKRKAKEARNEQSDDFISRRNRSRSENVLSMGERELNGVQLRNPPSSNDTTDHRDTATRVQPELHYLATDIVTIRNRSPLFDQPLLASPSYSPQNATRAAAADDDCVGASSADNLIEDIQNFEHTDASPYPQRRINKTTNQQESVPLQSQLPSSSSSFVRSQNEICIIDDHYSRATMSSSDSSEEFQSFSNEEIRNLK